MRRIHFCNHFHCDPIFTCPQAVHIAESVELARQYVEQTAADDRYRCILSEIDYLQGWWNIHTERREDFLRFLRDGRIETSGSYSEPNENSVGGEALLRNVVYGQWWLVDYLGATGNVYLPFDVFGHVRQLPQILAKCGFIGTSWTKGSPKHGRGNPEVAWWAAPDGSRLLNRVASYGGVDWGANDQFDGMQRLADRAKSDPPPHQPGADLLYRGSDFISPASWIEGHADELSDLGFEISLPSRYFSAVSNEIAESGLKPPVTTRDMSLYHSGTALSRIELKIGNRLAEHAVLEAETWGALATLWGHPYAEAMIDHAWRQILFSQHHDSITGTSNDQSYLDLMSHLREALAEGSDARDGALAALAARVTTDTAEGRPLVVFNSLNTDRSEPVTAAVDDLDPSGTYEVVGEDGTTHPADVIETPTGTQLRFVADSVPGIGYETYHLREAEARTPETLTSDDAQVVVETACARVTFDPWKGGGIVSLIDKSTGREVADPGSGHAFGDLVALKEGPGPEPSWEYRTTGERFSASTVRASVSAVQTPLGRRVTVTHAFPDTEGVLRTYELYDADPRIDCTVEILGYSGSRLIGRDRQNSKNPNTAEQLASCPEDRDMFGLLFPNGLSGVSSRWSDRFGSRVIRRSVNFLDFRTHQDRIESGSGLYSAEEWIAATPDVAITLADTEGRRGIPLGMVRVIHPDREPLRGAADRLIMALGARGIPATPYFDTEGQADDPLQTDNVIALGGSENAWISTQPEWKAITDTRYVRDIKLWGHDGKTIPALVLQGTDEQVASDVDALIAELADDSIAVPSGSVVSNAVVLLDSVGFAVLNRGTIAASCEPDGSLFMALQHATGWCDWATPLYLGHQFVPERKTNVFHYAVMPFAGSWADARVPERAAAFNRPMQVRAENRHSGDHPASQRLIEIDAEGSLVAAVKPAGQPSAQFTSEVSDAASGMVVRLWNWDRTSGTARVSLPEGISEAHLCDPAERVGESIALTGKVVSIPVSANGIESVIVTPTASHNRPGANAPTPARAVYSRWWLHNAGAAPAHNMPVSVAIHGDVLPGESEQVRVAVANNMRDQSFDGQVVIEGPSGWNVEPSTLSVSLAPMGTDSQVVTVTAPAGSPGRLTARMQHGGNEYIDTLVVGEAPEPSIRVERVEDGLAVRIANETNDRLDFTLTLVSPVEAWPEATDFARVPVAFRERQIVLAPSEARTADIPLLADFDTHAWAFVKVAFAGVVRYVQAPMFLTQSAHGSPGGPTPVRAARADASLNLWLKASGEVSAGIGISHAVPVDEKPVALDGVNKYWTSGTISDGGIVDHGELEVGIAPEDLGVAIGRDRVALARWAEDGWERVETTLDEKRWTLRTPLSAELLAAPQHWTITGDTDVLWRAKVSGRFFEADPYIGDIDGDGSPEIVIGTASNEIIVLDEEGAIRWRRRFTGWIWPSVRFTCADVTGDGRMEIVVATNDRSLVLLDCNGGVLWRRDDQPFAQKAAPVVADIDGDGEMEIVTSLYDHGVWAWRADGTPMWQTPLHPMLASTPLALDTGDGVALYVNLGGKRLVRLDGQGNVVFEKILADGHATARRAAVPVATDALHDGETEILVAGHDGQLRLITLDGEVIWSADVGGAVMGAPVVLVEDGAPPRVVCVNQSGTVSFVTTDGEVVHSTEVGSATQGSPVITEANGSRRIIVGSSGTPQTHVLDTAGNHIATYPFGAIWSHTPAVGTLAGTPGVVVTGTTDEHVVALKVRAAID